MNFKTTFLFIALGLMLSSCFHTSKINNLYNYGAQLTSNDVVLFTGYENKDSRVSKMMLKDMNDLLGKCGIETKYLYDPLLNREFLKAGFTIAEAHVDNEQFIYQMKQLYGISHIFSVGHVSEYEGDLMNVSREDAIYEQSGLVFEVYSLAEEKVVSSMQITGSSFMLTPSGMETDNEAGSIFKNYRKGIKKLLKSVSCN